MDTKAKKILITGGLGFVGRALVRRLASAHRVVVVDSERIGGVADRFSAAERAGFDFVAADIRSLGDMQAVMERHRPDAVIHLAAIHYIPDCEADPESTLQTNVLGTVNLLRSVPEGCRFVLASSGAVYAPSDEALNEDRSALGPHDVYGFSKRHAEDFVHYYAGQRQLACVIVRLFNVVGSGETNPHLVPELIAQLQAGRIALQLGNVWPRRDYIHVEDAAIGFAAAAREGAVAPGEVVTVNLGTARQYAVTDVVQQLREITGLAIELTTDPGRARKVDRPFLLADIRKVEARFGWKPALNLTAALEDAWARPELSTSLADRLRQLTSAVGG